MNGWFPPRCRLHGSGCSTPWGYDEDHTDSARPYTLDQLEHRLDAPHRYAYPDLDGYTAGFYLWRALRRDGRLNEEEAAVQWAGIEERLQEMMRA